MAYRTPLAVCCNATPEPDSALELKVATWRFLKTCRSAEFAYHARRENHRAVPLLRKSDEH
jgi:hypothetical protein